MTTEEQELLAGYRVSSAERREVLLDIAMGALRKNPRSRLQLIACGEPHETVSTIEKPALKLV